MRCARRVEIAVGIEPEKTDPGRCAVMRLQAAQDADQLIACAAGLQRKGAVPERAGYRVGNTGIEFTQIDDLVIGNSIGGKCGEDDRVNLGSDIFQVTDETRFDPGPGGAAQGRPVHAREQCAFRGIDAEQANLHDFSLRSR